MAEAYIIDATRSPTGKRRGSLQDVHAADLGAHVIKALVDRNPIPDEDSGERKQDLSRSEEGSSGLAEEITPRAISLRNEPNPFNPTTRLVYSLPEPSDVRIRIYDPRGALVRELYRGVAGAGENRIVWDGRNDRGEPVPSGVYFFALDVDGRPAGRHKLTLVK